MSVKNLNEFDLPKLRSSRPKSRKTNTSSVEKNHLEKRIKLPELSTAKRVVPETINKNGKNKKPSTFSNESQRFKCYQEQSSKNLEIHDVKTPKTKRIFLPPITQPNSPLKKGVTPISKIGVKKQEVKQINSNEADFKKLPPIKTEFKNYKNDLNGKNSPLNNSNVGASEAPTRENSKEESKYQQYLKKLNTSEENIRKRLLQSTHNLDSKSKATLDVLKRMCPNTDIYRQIFRGFRPVSTWSDSSEGSSEEEYLSLSRFSTYSSDNEYSTDADFKSTTPPPIVDTPPVPMSRRKSTAHSRKLQQTPDHSAKTATNLRGAQDMKDKLLTRSRKELCAVYGGNVKAKADASKKPPKTSNNKSRRLKRDEKMDILESRALARPFDTSL